MKIYKNYDEEPEDIFLPLTEKLYSELYTLEMDNYSADIPFYQRHLPASGNILEIGCGSGRVCRQLAGPQRIITAFDISLSMVTKARDTSVDCCHFLCMDMLNMAFSAPFDSVIIPYNTLNLLPCRDDILCCLRQCADCLTSSGRLCLQLYLPTGKIMQQRGKTFQFQIVDRPEGGKIIKEVLRKYISSSESIEIEERFRIRPMTKEQENKDYNHYYTLSALSFATWLDLFRQAGFILQNSYGSYDFDPFTAYDHSTLLAVLHKPEIISG